MRILVITNTFPSASETFVANHIRGLIRRGHTVTVLAKRRERGAANTPSETGATRLIYCSTAKKRNAAFASGLAGIRFALGHPKRFLRVLAQMRCHGDIAVSQAFSAAPLLRTETFDLTHAEFGPLGNIALALRACDVRTGPICTSFRGADISTYAARKPRSYTLLSRHGDLFLPVCEAFIPRLLALGFPEPKIRVYHSAVSLDELPLRPFRWSRTGRLELIAVGRFVEKKGFVRAVEVLARLRGSGIDAELVIIGDGDDREAIEDQARKLGVSGNVRLPGWLPHAVVADRLRHADVYLGTSLTSEAGELEGIPNVLKEAMAVGLPVVAFDHSGVSELVRNGETGWLVVQDEIAKMVDRMADAVRSLMVDPSTVEHTVLAARRLIESSYALDSQAEEAERLYQSLVERGSAGI